MTNDKIGAEEPASPPETAFVICNLAPGWKESRAGVRFAPKVPARPSEQHSVITDSN
jgi:hypothetical protein